MASDPVAHLDRRQRRRQESIEEVLDHAVEIMAEQGVAGLSIGEIARRMDIRPPSLYVYFPSKNALYDALFARGAQSVLDAFTALDESDAVDGDDLQEALSRFGEMFVRWSMENRAYSQLLFWRPVPGFEPSEAAYEPAVILVERSRARFAHFQERGLIRADVDIEAVLRDWTILTAGVVSQQMSNAPDDSYETGRFTAALPDLVAMFVAHYGSSPATSASQKAKRTTATGRGHARKR